jgi:hypothetical protein
MPKKYVNHIRQEVRRVNRTSPIVQEDLRLYQSRFQLQRDTQARGEKSLFDRMRSGIGWSGL